MVERDLDAGVRWAQNGVTYLLKGKKYWRVNKAGKTTQRNTNGR